MKVQALRGSVNALERQQMAGCSEVWKPQEMNPLSTLSTTPSTLKWDSGVQIRRLRSLVKDFIAQVLKDCRTDKAREIVCACVLITRACLCL
jgi:hypothetical protein